MAVTLGKFHFHPRPVNLYVATWDDGAFVTHDYVDEDRNHYVQPLVFRYDEQEEIGEDRYAYHISPDGYRHGFEQLRVPDGDDYKEAKLWTARSMLKSIVGWFTNELGIKEPTLSVGRMDNDANDAYAYYDYCGLSIGVHITRPDALEPNADSQTICDSIFFTCKQDGNWRKTFGLDPKEEFIKECLSFLQQ